MNPPPETSGPAGPRDANIEWLVGPNRSPLALHHLGGAGRDLLMVHATGLHARVWETVAARLSDWRCHAVDLRGHGYSPLPVDDELGWEGFGNDVGAAADHLGPGLVGVGHSLGGVALLMAAVADPSRFALLVLYEPAMRAETGPLAPELRELQAAMVTMSRGRRATFDSRADALASYARKAPFAGILAAALHSYVEHGFIEDEGGRVTLRCIPEVEARAFARTHDHDLLTRLDTISCPVVVVRGGDTSPHQAESSTQLAELLGAPAQVLDGADHFGPLAQPSQFASVVRAAAAGLPAAAGTLT